MKERGVWGIAPYLSADEKKPSSICWSPDFSSSSHLYFLNLYFLIKCVGILSSKIVLQCVMKGKPGTQSSKWKIDALFEDSVIQCIWSSSAQLDARRLTNLQKAFILQRQALSYYFINHFQLYSQCFFVMAQQGELVSCATQHDLFWSLFLTKFFQTIGMGFVCLHCLLEMSKELSCVWQSKKIRHKQRATLRRDINHFIDLFLNES